MSETRDQQDTRDTQDERRDVSRRDFVAMSVAAGLVAAAGTTSAQMPVVEKNVDIKIPTHVHSFITRHRHHPGVLIWPDASACFRAARDGQSPGWPRGTPCLVPNLSTARPSAVLSTWPPSSSPPGTAPSAAVDWLGELARQSEKYAVRTAHTWTRSPSGSQRSARRLLHGARSSGARLRRAGRVVGRVVHGGGW